VQSPKQEGLSASPITRRASARNEGRADNKPAPKTHVFETEEEDCVDPTQHEPDDDYEPDAKKSRSAPADIPREMKTPAPKVPRFSTLTDSAGKSTKSLKPASNPAVNALSALAASVANARKAARDSEDEHALADTESDDHAQNVRSGAKNKGVEKKTPLQIGSVLDESALSNLATHKKVRRSLEHRILSVIEVPLRNAGRAWSCAYSLQVGVVQLPWHELLKRFFRHRDRVCSTQACARTSRIWKYGHIRLVFVFGIDEISLHIYVHAYIHTHIYTYTYAFAFAYACT
jgi:hypothetical protein